MNKSDLKNIDQHVTILGWVMIASHLFMLVIAAFVFFLLLGVGAVSGDPEAVRILPIVGTAVSSFIVALTVPGLLAGWGLLKRKSWARLLSLIIGVLNLMNFPFGTALGVYTIWVLLQDGSSDYFMEYKLAS
ncbi:MAG: hypothetical protein GY943_39540 [Chloroflexi bacterium]|nr:hypothetical protein [Chloroflexota bacterium]